MACESEAAAALACLAELTALEQEEAALQSQLEAKQMEVAQKEAECFALIAAWMECEEQQMSAAPDGANLTRHVAISALRRTIKLLQRMKKTATHPGSGFSHTR